MSDSMMDTERGGENTQYESIKTVTNPAPKDGGDMGEPETQAPTSSSQTPLEQEARGQQTADNIRYGQNISESGVGGMTTTSEGTANAGGYGETEAQGEEEKTAGEKREEAGYGEGEDMDNTIGG